MTTQVLEQITYKETIFPTISEPLHSYLVAKDIQLPSQSSACWRGYIGHWLIEEDRLYLMEIGSYRHNPKKIKPSLQSLFPNQSKIFAEWFCGKIRIEEGKALHYFGRGHYVREKSIFLIFEQGILRETEVLHHSKLSPS